MPKSTLITMAEYARLRGVSKAAVKKAVDSGRIKLVQGKVDPESADRQWEENTNKRQQRAWKTKRDPSPREAAPKQTSPEGKKRESQNEATARKETALANLREIDEAERRRELIPAAEVEAKWGEVGTRVREEVEAMGPRIINRLPDEWRREVNRVLKDEMRRALTAISDEFLSDQQAA